MAHLPHWHCGEGAVVLETRPWTALSLCPPAPVAENLAGQGTFSQLCSDHLSLCSCCSFLSLSSFFPPSFEEELFVGIRHRPS